MDAFASLVPQAAAATNGHEPSKLLGFFAQEMQLFFNHIQKAVTTYTETGDLPSSLFNKRAVNKLEKAAGTGRKKGSRRPSAFNFFIKDELRRLKAAAGPKAAEDKAAHKQFFSKAASAWSALTKEEKEGMNKKYKEQIEAWTADGGGGSGEDHSAEHSAEHSVEHSADAGAASGSTSDEEDSSSEDDDSPPPLPVAPPSKKKKTKH